MALGNSRIKRGVVPSTSIGSSSCGHLDEAQGFWDVVFVVGEGEPIGSCQYSELCVFA